MIPAKMLLTKCIKFSEACRCIQAHWSKSAILPAPHHCNCVGIQHHSALQQHVKAVAAVQELGSPGLGNKAIGEAGISHTRPWLGTDARLAPEYRVTPRCLWCYMLWRVSISK